MIAACGGLVEVLPTGARDREIQGDGLLPEMAPPGQNPEPYTIEIQVYYQSARWPDSFASSRQARTADKAVDFAQAIAVRDRIDAARFVRLRLAASMRPPIIR